MFETPTEFHTQRTEGHRAMHESHERYATVGEALDAISAKHPQNGRRWIAKACGVCRGWHIDKVSGDA